MPTYEYKCEACGKHFDKFQSIKADALKKCPYCGKHKLKRLIGAGAALIFKGSGFYITDYRDAAYKDKAKSEASASETKSDSKDAPASSSGDAKPAASNDSGKSPAPAATPTPKAESTAKPSGGKSEPPRPSRKK